jgi:regulator of ribosome biosynthesis
MSWPIMEVKRNDDPFDDPWEKARDAKKDRVDKNTVNKMRNAEKSGELERGTTSRIMKAKVHEREMGRAGGRLDMKNFSNVPAGVPMDMAEKKGAEKQRGKDKTKLALMATQRSTASMGKFDQMREGEPERRKAMAGLKKRKFESGTTKDGAKTEAKKSLKVLQNIIDGGGRAKELAIRRGEHARGETGHDYEFNDGLTASKYKKKKGRAGIGKMSKVTKKMSK